MGENDAYRGEIQLSLPVADMTGKVRWNVTPGLSSRVSHSPPPWASTIELAPIVHGK